MPISLSDLESALESISSLGREEVTFEVLGQTLTFKVPTPQEEVEIYRYAMSSYEVGSEEDPASGMDFLDRFRIAALSTSLIQIGSLDLRSETHVLTGDKLPTGVAIKIPRSQAVRQFLAPWGRSIHIGMYSKLMTLVLGADSRAESAVEYDPADIDTEIERLKARAAELEAEKERLKTHQGNLIRGHYEATLKAGQAATPRPPSAPPVQETPEQEDPEDQDQDPGGDQAEVFTSVPEPAPEPAPEPEAPESLIPVYVPPPPPQSAGASEGAEPDAYDPLSQYRSSFVGDDDMDAEIEREAARIRARRAQQAASAPIRPPTPPTRPVPHQGAAQVASALGAQNNPASLKAMQAQDGLDLPDGLDTHGEPVNISGGSVLPGPPPPRQGKPAAPPLDLNPVQRGSANPRFRKSDS